MLYLVSDASRPVSFSAAGNLTNDDQFLHPKRTQDSYELISVIKGVLHIQSGTQSYHLAPGQFVLLFPGECHFGTQPSEGELSFYWTHFYLRSEDAAIYDEQQTAAFIYDPPLSLIHI